MTASPVIKLARRLMGDVETPYRWNTNEVVMPFLAQAQRDVLKERSDAWVQADGTVGTLTDPTTSNSAMYLDENWSLAMAAKTAALCRTMEAGDKADQARANALMALYAAEVGV